MKLLFCKTCEDIVKLSKATKTCQCGECGGHYEADGINAVYYGKAMPLGFANSTFVDAMSKQPEYGKGIHYTSFVIPKVCPTMVHVDYMEYSPSDGGRDYEDVFDELMDKAELDKKWSNIENVFKQKGDSTI